MKRRVLSFILVLTLCLNLCPVWTLAADTGSGDGLCPHHPAHTDECGYVSPTVGRECTHSHDEACYSTETVCVHEHTAECYPETEEGSETGEPDLCAHTCTQDSGCVTQTLDCRHVHDDSCGYAEGESGAACTFDCPICPIEDLIASLPGSLSEDNSEQVQAQISEIYDRYEALTEEEQQQVDLSPCMALLDQLDGMDTDELSDSDAIYGQDLSSDKVYDPYGVSKTMVLKLNSFTLSGKNTCAIQITAAGALTIKGAGKVIAPKGAGVEIQSGGSLIIEDPSVTIEGDTYALDIASGANVKLSAGTYTGGIAAIKTKDGKFDALLAPGCAYLGTDGSPIAPADVATAKTITVGQCTEHKAGESVHVAGTTTHTWSCAYCGTKETEKCSFTFDENGVGKCGKCNNQITIEIDETSLGDLIYNGTDQTANVKLTIKLDDGTELEKSAYDVRYSTRVDVGEITVTVTGIAFDGTFTKTYNVDQDQPALVWDTTDKPAPIIVDYDGAPVEASDLPPVKINIVSTIDNLKEYLQYSYKIKDSDTDYIDGLPTNAGTYDVIVSLPEMPNFKPAVSAPITLTIKAINPIVTAPAAIQPVFNRTEQALVTAGTLCDVAVRDGIEIQFATSENGPYSTTIPTGTDAGNHYRVWYKVQGTNNIIGVDPIEIENVEIQRKQIEPVVELSEYTYLYDGGYHQPKVTVKDTDRLTVLLSSEYEVEYKNNRDVGLAEVIVSDKAGGNYYIMPSVTVNFKITTRTQETLSITQKPNTVTYGDKFTLSTSGGSGNGNVTWEIINGSDVATIDENSGQVTIIGHGSATVKATKSGSDPNSTPDPTPASRAANYEDATAIWTFTADKKAVVATVTAEDKAYDGSDVATVHAVVEQGVLPGDEITITGLTGTFSDENAGVDKTVTVTVDKDSVSITGNNSQHYDVSYSSTPVKATIRKAIANITAPTGATLTYNGTAQALIDTAAVVNPTSVSVEYALSETGPYSTDIPKATNAGTYTVWYRVEETENYTGLAPASVDVSIKKKSVVPTITLDQGSFTYDGTAKEPVVTLTEDDGTTVIPASEYTVEYSNNINVGNATVKVTAKDDGNYTFTNSPVTINFEITKEQAKVIAPPEAAGDPLTFKNSAQNLVTPGIGTGGTLVYSVNGENGTYQEAIPRETNAREYTVHYKVKGDANHRDSEVGSVKVTIAPKTVKDPTIELFDENDNALVSYTYDGNAKTPKVVVKDGSDIIDEDEYNVIYSDNINAGRAAVNITAKPGVNYTVTGSTTFVILKADITFDPLPTADDITYDGKPHELLRPGTTSGGEVLYALNSATSTYTAAIPTATEAGKYTVYYKVVGDENHNNFAVQSVLVTIERKPLNAVAIELTPNNFDYDGTVKMPEVKVLDGKTVLPEEEYAWECSSANPVNVGTYTIEVSDAPGGNYDLSNVSANTATFSIGKVLQEELVIESKPASTNYGETFTLTTSGGSGTGAVTWAVTSGDAATVDETTGDVEITGVGEVTITATNPGDTNYQPISAEWTFTAAPRPVTASVTVTSRAYDGTTDADVASANITTLNGDTVTIDPTSITATFDTPSVGTGKTVTLDTSKVKVTGNNADKYEISYPETVTADITQAMTTVTTHPSAITPLTYSGEPQALITAGETNVGFLVYSLDGTNFSPEIPTGTDAGIYDVYYKVDGTADYTDVEVNTTPISVTIGPKTITPTVTLMPVSFVYNGTKQEPVITVYDEGTVIDKKQYKVTWESADGSTTKNILTDVGTYTATITAVENGNYKIETPPVIPQLEIIPAIQDAMKITGKPDHVYYGDTVRLDTIGGTGNGTVTWSVTGGATSAITANGELTVTGIGKITVTAERAVPNYGTASDDWTFTVEPKPVTAEVTITAKDYDGTTDVADANITAAVKSTDLVDPSDSFTISGLKGTYADANAGTNKTVTLNVSQMSVTGDTGKYNVSCPATTKGDINRKSVDSLTVELSGNDLKTENNGTNDTTYYYEYDGTEKKPTVTVTDGGSTTLAASDYSVGYSNNKNFGEATVTVTANSNGNYTFNDKVVKFEIRKADAVLTLPPRANDLTYNGADQELVSAGTVTGGHIEYLLDKNTYSQKIPTGADAGTYTVHYKVVGDSNHTSNTTGQVSVTIKPKEIISPKITVAGSYTYTGSAVAPDDDNVTVEDGDKTIESTEYNLSYRDNINAGTATVIVTNANGGNYIVNGTGTFVIDKAAAPTATAPTGQNLPYNGTAQELVKAGSATGGTMVYSLSNTGEYSPAIPTGTAVGSYTVWYKVQGDDNHEDSVPVLVNASIVVNNVTNPTIQVKPETVTYNGEKQEPTVTVQDDNGLVIDGSEYTVTYSDETGNNDLTKVGEYTLTITGVVNGNYTFDDTSNQNTATFKILPAGQTPLTITNTRERVYYGDTIQLGTTGGNGTVTWKVDNTSSSIANISNGLLKITGVGSVTVTATSTATGYTDQTATWSFHADKKPVTAVVTAKSKTYDGKTDAEVTAKLQNSDLVEDDKIEITLKGSFGDPNVGTDKTVYVDSTAPEFSDDSTNKENYNITYPATTTASILKADIDITKVTLPAAATGLVYTGIPLTLLTSGGIATGGTMEYSLDDKTYSVSFPTATDAGDYDIWYRVKGDGNHNDVEGKKLASQVTIAQQTVTNPIIEFTPSGASFDGAVHKPSVTVKDNSGRVIPSSEYTVDYGSTDWKTAGNHTVTVKNNEGGNYVISQKTETFKILMMGQNPLSIVDKPGKVQYGDTFTLSTTGGSGTGAVEWACDKTDIATIDRNGTVKVEKAGGPVTITATKQADDNFSTVTDTWSFSVEKKPVTPIVTAKDKEYDTSDIAELVITWKDGDLLNKDTITLNLTGTFDNASAGTNKTVKIRGTAPTDDRYNITLPTSTTASITPKTASVNGSVTAPSLTYNGSEQRLVNSSATVTGGDLVYSRDGSYYTQLIPTEKNAGTYPVWYKAQAEAGGNYKDSPAVRLNVTIEPKPVNNPTIELSPSTFVYDGTAKKPDVIVKDGSTLIPASEYTVSYSNNITVGTATVTITDVDGGNYIVNGTKTFEITAATATLIDAPEPNDLTYNGRQQALVTSGTAENGRVVYSTTETGSYSTTIPKGTDADTYEVWYKVQGLNGASDTEPDSVSVTIQPKQVTPIILLNDQYGFSTPYTGNEIKPTVTVIVDGQQLAARNYSTRYSNNKDVGTATVIVQSTNGNYQFYTFTTFEITKGKAEFLKVPTAVDGLVYTGEPHELVTGGTSTHGLVLYSLDAFSYSTSIPTGTKKGNYVVYAKVQGGSVYEESELVSISVQIGMNVVKNPTIILSQNSFNYTGSEIKPTVTMTDDNGNEIPASEYTVIYSDNTAVGTATVTVKSKGSNYSFEKSTTFTIVGADQSLLEITGKKDTVYYGDTLTLGTSGGSGSGAVTWAVKAGTDVADINNTTGVVTIKKSGSVTITATKAGGSDGYKDAVATWTFFAQRKPVNAVVTAADKIYDGNNTAKLTAAISSSALVSNDTVTVTATGHFADENVGTNKTVIIDSLTVPDGFQVKYDIRHPETVTASITPADAKVMDTDKPEAATDLTYNGSEQNLLESAGTAEGGNLAYSLNGVDYSFNIPTGTDAKTYSVWYKVIASDGNHKDSAPTKLEDVTIDPNTDAPTVLCTPSTFQYDGTEKTPTVVVRDDAQRVIPESEYTVEFEKTPRIAAGKYKVTITDKPGGNYEFNTSREGVFEIVPASQAPLSIITDKPTNVYYGDTFRLSAMGGSGNGEIVWSIDKTDVAEITQNGVVTVKKGDSGFTVNAYRKGLNGYSDSNTDSVPFEAKPKPVTPVVTADNKPYDGSTNATLKAAWPSGALVEGDMITLTVEGQFVTVDVGTNKRVDITKREATGANADYYTITWPESTTASISKVDAKIGTKPEPILDLVYDGTAKELVSPGLTVGGIGTIVYSLRQDGVYSEEIPKGIVATTYTVWYKVADSVNYTGIPAAKIEVTIERQSTDSASRAVMRTTVQDGTASTVLNAAAGRKLVNEAVAAQSDSIVIKPEITSDVTKAQVSIPSSTVSQIKNQTNAALTVSAPIADVTIPNAALETLSSAGGTVNVATEQVDQAVVLTLTADGKSVEDVPGGVTLTVPAEDAGPGTVAVLVHEDGTRETVRKSVAEDGKVNIPLSGSATVEIVDNSKEFEDVPSTSWASDAVDFASAHELFNGTSETTFSPDQPMSRGMLATVLYNLEGSPAQEQASTFSDVSSDAWYADGVAWAAENGIADGYGDGQFGPDESITREQFVVMLWKYAGSPKAKDPRLDFTDADQVSGYAQEALCWAVENGILNGVGDGQLAPGGTATRAQAAQILKRFMENI